MSGIKRFLGNLAFHPTLANLLMVLFLVLGLLTVREIRRETFPDFAATTVSVTAVYPGATAEDVESAVCERIEDAVESIANLQKVTSKAAEGVATVTLEMEEGADATEFLNDIKTEVDAISTFPDQVEDVVVRRLNKTDQVVSLAVTGPMTPSHLKIYGEQLRDKLKRLPLISQVELKGFSQHQILVEIPAYQMMRLGLSVTDISSIVGNQSLDMPAGEIESDDTDYLIRFTEERRTAEQVGELVVFSNKGGSELKLKEIATISERFEDREDSVWMNGKRAALLQISKNKSEDALRIMDEVHRFVDLERQTAPPGVRFVITQNISKVIRDRLNMLVINGIEGLALVFLTLWLFFNLRMSFWVTMGLPVSFCMTFFLMKQIGFSFNMLSMVGLLIAIGILMDDAIVIVENIAAEMEKGKTPHQATLDGLFGVSGGVISSFLTTVFVFGALALSMSGDIGKVLYAIPVVLILTLSVSLVEAFCILPNHLQHSLAKTGSAQTSRFRKRFEARLDQFRHRVLGPAVDFAVKNRYLFLGCVIFLFFSSVGMIAGGVLKISPFPDIDGDVLQARILMPQGTSLDRTEKVVAHLVDAMKRFDHELTPEQPDGKPLVENYSILYSTNQDAGEKGPHVATVSLDLLSAEERNTSLDEIIRRWREYVGVVPDVINIAYKEPSIGPGGLALEIDLQGEDLAQLKRASTRLIEWLRGYEGIFDLNDNLRPGKPEFRVHLNRGALAMGFTAREIAAQLHSAFRGTVASEIQYQGESYEVLVRLADADRKFITDLSGFRIIDKKGNKVPLQNLATVEQARGYGTINRINGRRTVTITGDVDTEVANAAEIVGDARRTIFQEIEKEFPGVKILLEGQDSETRKSMLGMVRAFLIGIFGVFIILSIQFRSYLEPLAVMAIIPLALIGVIWGHILMGLELTMPSIMGFVSLAGVVVNDSILLVNFIRKRMEEGRPVAEAATRASRDRFRAVLLTSMTTIVGLLPLMLERSMQAQVLIPLASSIVFGLMVTTLLVLLVIPALYTVLDDLGMTRKS